MSALFSWPTVTVGIGLPSAGVVLVLASRSGGRAAPVVLLAGVLVCGPGRAGSRPGALFPGSVPLGRLARGVSDVWLGGRVSVHAWPRPRGRSAAFWCRLA